MTIQWTLVAAFLYLELALIFLLLLPFISPKVWQYTFYSRFCQVVASKANVYFTVFMIVLLFFFLDSIREMVIYSRKTSIDLGQELQIQLKLFRSQRNYYISGFTVFLFLVIRRLVMLILCEADLLSENESTMKRAHNATETVEKILKKMEEENESIFENEKAAFIEASFTEAEELRKAVEEAKRELDKNLDSIADVKYKSQLFSDEYEVLVEEHAALLSKVAEHEKQKSEANTNIEEVENDS